eukprot:9389653-Pyramimonas_sp.AAC.1
MDVVVGYPSPGRELDSRPEDSARNDLKRFDDRRAPRVGQGEVGGEGGRTPCANIHVADEERGERQERTVDMI